MTEATTETFDILISGAGPAGTTCALALKDSGLKVAVLEKSVFPRDKICGDAIPTTARKVLQSLSAEYLEQLEKFPSKSKMNGCRVVAPNLSYCNVYFKVGGYTSARFDFDNFMFNLASKNSPAEFFMEESLKAIQSYPDFIEIKTSKNRILKTRLLIGCDGAHSIATKKLTDTLLDPMHHSGAVRAYYKNVSDTDPGMMEIHFLKDFLPGYFWIFPLQNGVANVGFGVLTQMASDMKMNLRKSLEDIVTTSPVLKERFKDATLVDEIRGFGLPLGSRKVSMSGDRFLLAGDAASLIDPATGEGIGNAMLSGKLAALQAIECFQKNNFTKNFMKRYDDAVYDKLWKDLRNKYYIQRLINNRQWMVNFFIYLSNNNSLFRKMMLKLF
jgi:geranylgeranyl reductase family protein